MKIDKMSTYLDAVCLTATFSLPSAAMAIKKEEGFRLSANDARQNETVNK